jgi:hypothetical protein
MIVAATAFANKLVFITEFSFVTAFSSMFVDARRSRFVVVGATQFLQHPFEKIR